MVLLILSFASCKEDTLEPSIEGSYLGYFPLNTGFWLEYKADSIVHLDSDDIFNIDTAIQVFTFEIREEIDDGYYDAEGEWAHRITRYKRTADSLPWTFLNVWTAKINSRSAQRVEENVRFVKLGFPIERRKTWDGNAYNFFPEELYFYKDIHANSVYGGMVFDSSVTVIQNDFVSNINRIDKKEVYANQVGLIYKQQDSVGIVNLPNGSTVILSGVEYRLEIINYKR